MSGAVRDGIGGTALRGNLHFIADCFDIDRCYTAVGEGQTFQVQRNQPFRFCCFIDIDHNLPIAARTACREFGGLGNGNRCVGDGQIGWSIQCGTSCIISSDTGIGKGQRSCYRIFCGAAAAQCLYCSKASWIAVHLEGTSGGTAVRHLCAAGVKLIRAGRI